MGDFFGNLFSTADFPQRWHCGNWTLAHGWLHILSDLLTWGAYTAIPLVILYFVIRRGHVIPFPGLAWFFAAFIFACGTTHLIEAALFWWPTYRLLGVVKAATAIVSWGTVFAMIPIVPKALALPGLAEVNASLEREISDRKKAEQALALQADRLRAVNAELERSNQELDDFAYIAAHDLKEPLRGIHNFSEFLREDYGDRLDPEGLEQLETIQKMAKRMDALIVDLHQYSRAGRAELKVRETDLNEVVKAATESAQTIIAEKNAQIEIVRTLPTTHCDPTRLEVVFGNLIVNGVKYNESSMPLVEIGWLDGDANHGPIFYVRDNGIGIPPHHRELVFEMFKRLHKQSAYGGGTGAGLTIVRKILERHGGRVWLESEVGKGTTFFFTIGPGDAP